MDRRVVDTGEGSERGATTLEYGVMTFVLLVVLAVSVTVLVKA